MKKAVLGLFSFFKENDKSLFQLDRKQKGAA